MTKRAQLALPRDLAGNDMWASPADIRDLLATKARAFTPCPSEYVASYAGMNPVLASLTAVMTKADPDIV